MRLTHFHLENYGPIQSIDLTLDPKFNVIAGVNGAGKTSILNAISVMLSRYVSAVRTGRASGLLSLDVIRKGARSVEAVATAVERNQEFTWSAVRARPLFRGSATKSGELISFVNSISDNIESNPECAPLPLVAFYPVNRAVLDIPLRIRKKEKFEQYAALDGALLQGARNFRTFFAWFREREDVENETRAGRSSFRDVQLEAVRKAVEELIPGCTNLRVRRQPLRMLITKDRTDLRVDQLSDGEKTMLALAGDLARRLALANPGSKDPLRGTGVILIDELELHLHPAWQRLAVEKLQKIFPRCQFIVSTHSPQVLSEVPAEGVFLLKDGEIERPTNTMGRDSSLILEELMEATSRPAWAYQEIKQLYDSIDDKKMGAAQQVFNSLARRIGESDPALTPARLALRRKVPKKVRSAE